MSERTDICGASFGILRMFLLLFIIIENITKYTDEWIFFYHEEFCRDICEPMRDDHIHITLEYIGEGGCTDLLMMFISHESVHDIDDIWRVPDTSVEERVIKNQIGAVFREKGSHRIDHIEEKLLDIWSSDITILIVREHMLDLEECQFTVCLSSHV